MRRVSVEKDIRREEIVIEEKLTSTNNNNNNNKPTSNKSFSEIREKESRTSSSETKMINSSSLQNESAESAAKVYIHKEGGERLAKDFHVLNSPV